MCVIMKLTHQLNVLSSETHFILGFWVALTHPEINFFGAKKAHERFCNGASAPGTLYALLLRIKCSFLEQCNLEPGTWNLAM